MKKLFVVLAMMFSVSAIAAPVDWKADLDAYRASVKNSSYTMLVVYRAANAAAAVSSCSTSLFFVGVSALADTFPGVGNIASESIANMANVDYQTYQNLLEWDRAADVGRGLLGGGVVGGLESMEFVFRLLAGHPNESFSGLAKVYASTFATMDALFAEESLCVMSQQKVAVLAVEMASRWHAPLKPVNPSVSPRP